MKLITIETNPNDRVARQGVGVLIIYLFIKGKQGSQL